MISKKHKPASKEKRSAESSLATTTTNTARATNSSLSHVGLGEDVGPGGEGSGSNYGTDCSELDERMFYPSDGCDDDGEQNARCELESPPAYPGSAAPPVTQLARAPCILALIILEPAESLGQEFQQDAQCEQISASKSTISICFRLTISRPRKRRRCLVGVVGFRFRVEDCEGRAC